jgi:hypothetical protein
MCFLPEEGSSDKATGMTVSTLKVEIESFGASAIEVDQDAPVGGSHRRSAWREQPVANTLVVAVPVRRIAAGG